eukprot:jgi/Phyca11/503376/fgenesh2_kg.PHYCAscaffold_3_\
MLQWTCNGIIDLVLRERCRVFVELMCKKISCGLALENPLLKDLLPARSEAQPSCQSRPLANCFNSAGPIREPLILTAIRDSSAG